MIAINTTDTSGRLVEIPEANFQKAIISYLRSESPDRVKIIAEQSFATGEEVNTPVAICMLAKNPEQISHYTDVVEKE